MKDYNELSRSCPSGSFSYTIKAGDTLYQLARTYNTTVEAILAINPGINPNNLQIGQRICIPESGTPSPRCPSGSFAYTIKQGDTLWQLARTYNTTVEAIMALNPGIDPNNLRIGQVICIPSSTPPHTCPTGSFAYTIKQGDTLWQLARTYNTTVEAIMALNPGIDPNNLRIGQVICIPSSTPPHTCPTGSFAYTIKQGDTLWELARTYNTTVEAIMAINPGLDPNNLRVGQVICIPRGTPPHTCPTGSFAYTIKQGDTLWELARTYNTTVEAIMAINPGLDPNNLRVGQVICIPRSTPPTCDGLYYVVRPGDTLYSIAMKYDVTVASLIAANPGIDPNNLQVGQLICIPKVEPPIPCPGGTVYVVRQNDSLSTILLRFNISVMDLMAGNPNLDIDKIRVGQQLCILPHKDRGCPCKKGTKPYRILPSDIPHEGPVVAALAMKFNTTVSYLMQANPNMAPGDFKAGVEICVPN